MKRIPVYRYPWSYVVEQAPGDAEIYRASRKANKACKEAIDTAISGNYKGWSLDTKAAAKQVITQFGIERVVYILAITIRKKDWDGRLSTANKLWASTIPIYRDESAFCALSLKSHPGLIDLFANEIRKAYELHKNNQ